MTRLEIETKVREILDGTLGDDVQTAPLDASLAGLGADSLDRLEITLELEDAFQIELTDEEGERAQTIGDVVNLVAGKLSVSA